MISTISLSQMIAPLATVTFSSTQLLPASAVLVRDAFTSNNSKHNIKIPRLKGASLGFPIVTKGRIALVHASSMTNFQELWEDPTDGSESEEVEEHDLDFESDWEIERDVLTMPTRVAEVSTSNYEEDLVKEVEHLLDPEEMEDLQQNETPNLEKISNSKWNLLHTFALAGQIPFMDNLLENGLDLDLVDKDGLTALHTAIIGKKEAVTSHLLRKGASFQVRDLDGATPLHYAVQVGAVQTVKLLIKYKVDVNIADNEGWTPLHVAVQSRNRDIAKLLLVNGADKTRRTKDGKTALDISLCYGKDFKSYDIAKLLKIELANRWL